MHCQFLLEQVVNSSTPSLLTYEPATKDPKPAKAQPRKAHGSVQDVDHFIITLNRFQLLPAARALFPGGPRLSGFASQQLHVLSTPKLDIVLKVNRQIITEAHAIL